MIDPASESLSQSIDRVSGAISEWALLGHADQDPSLPKRFGPKWRELWKGDIATRLSVLSNAVAVNRPDVFAACVRWSDSMFNLRQLSRADLRASIDSLVTVMTEELPETAGEFLAPFWKAAFDVFEEAPQAEAPFHPPESALLYLEAVLSGDSDRALASVKKLLQSGLSLGQVYKELVFPVQVELGELWRREEISIADEHFATATTLRALTQIRFHFEQKAPNGRRFVATAIGGDLHEIGLRMVSDTLELQGWSAFYAGANTPSADILEALLTQNAELLVVSASTLTRLRTLAQLCRTVREGGAPGVKILVGGGPFNLLDNLWKDVGAHGWAPSAQAAVETAMALVVNDDPQA